MSKDLSKLKEQYEALGREIEALETPKSKHEIAADRLYFALGGMLFDTKESYERAAIKVLEAVYGDDKPKTRYNWPEIIKKHPEAQWASTDYSGRVDLWVNKPVIMSSGWFMEGGGCLVGGGYARAPSTPDWCDSLEKRPDWI